MKALEKQVGGNYYKIMPIQPYEYFLANNVPHHKAAIFRRILRYDQPGGQGIIDLDKILHETELIEELSGTRSPILLYNFITVNNIPPAKAEIIQLIYNYDLPAGKGFDDLAKIRQIVNQLKGRL